MNDNDEERAQRLRNQQTQGNQQAFVVSTSAVSHELLWIWHRKMERLDQLRWQVEYFPRSQAEAMMREQNMAEMKEIIAFMKSDISGKIEGSWLREWTLWRR